MAYYFRRNVLSSRLATYQVMFLQSQKVALRYSNHNLFHSSLSKSFTNTAIHSSPHNIPSKESSSSPNLNKNLVKFSKGPAKRLPVSILVNLVIAGLVSVDLLYAWLLNKYNEHLVNNTVEKGTQPEIYISDDQLFPRPLVVDRLKKIFQPDRDQSFYHVVCGEYGTGKTILTKMASREVGQGVIYVEIPSDPSDHGMEGFGKVFGESLNFKFEEHISFTALLMKRILGYNVDEQSKWRKALKAFKNASAVYKAKHNKLPVIIYDNTSGLVDADPKILDTLQEDAKWSADNRKYIAIFVNNEDSVSSRMRSRRSAWSRADISVIEIGDLSEDESIDYLVNKRKIKKEEAIILYDFVGGCIIDLKFVADKFLAGQKIEVIKQQILIEITKRFWSAKLLQNQTHHKAGKSAIDVLLKSKEIDANVFKRFFKDGEKYNEVLKAKVFAYNPSRNTVTFRSKLIEAYIKENPNMFQ
ncbi:hypothetical protein RclHR1_01510001 [Rhizophagus clarus]|uniref:P-loop containing nucleoside triphosphate hydrolase protein n=1 Tax=Rhizophagus clarus TaxID=94130 RepID=A0A2Z6QED7_9GLOM|nr:hypothetical protein RclHR1_01510001 [Rhizophagus clarus]GET02561.1 P-loop containing nucleoside triphosphate hydrolase protein [Rhizophagus clarus]